MVVGHDEQDVGPVLSAEEKRAGDEGDHGRHPGAEETSPKVSRPAGCHKGLPGGSLATGPGGKGDEHGDVHGRGDEPGGTVREGEVDAAVVLAAALLSAPSTLFTQAAGGQQSAPAQQNLRQAITDQEIQLMRQDIRAQRRQIVAAS